LLPNARAEAIVAALLTVIATEYTLLDTNKSAKSVSTAVKLVCNAATSAAVAVVAIDASIASTSACNVAKEAVRPDKSTPGIAFTAAVAASADEPAEVEQLEQQLSQTEDH
jgi:hypothetical protein